ncbi:hypothetical protein PSACC_00447 [Paramicrosporidium saccamoebae]|uniref:Uncharacterized protein n=1 Tax=Paramicrosporidium saccamoebae TaxID=1246581 RepID=A0A2H9TQ28_9FUNG|nr:hypothetical protein PSACC_00447 [Paramicrosporidium saccamoebae]
MILDLKLGMQLALSAEFAIVFLFGVASTSMHHDAPVQLVQTQHSQPVQTQPPQLVQIQPPQLVQIQPPQSVQIQPPQLVQIQPPQSVQVQHPQLVQTQPTQHTDHIQYLVVPSEQKIVFASPPTKMHQQTGGTMNCQVTTHTINMKEISPGQSKSIQSNAHWCLDHSVDWTLKWPTLTCRQSLSNQSLEYDNLIGYDLIRLPSIYSLHGRDLAIMKLLVIAISTLALANASGDWGYSPNSAYGQPPSSSYGQPSSQYGQPPSYQYGQQPPSQYGQQNPSYGQSPPPQYGQGSRFGQQQRRKMKLHCSCTSQPQRPSYNSPQSPNSSNSWGPGAY